MSVSARMLRWSRANWFLIVAPVLFGMAWAISRAAFTAPDAKGLEAALLFDAGVTLPVLYAVCYWRERTLPQLAIRMIGTACLGVYLLTWIVSPNAQVLLPEFTSARYVGLAILILIELRLVAETIKLVFAKSGSASEVSARTGAPPLIAKLMVLEARFWKSVWSFFRRRP